jgi:hypothetical protein
MTQALYAHMNNKKIKIKKKKTASQHVRGTAVLETNIYMFVLM